jgi:hypothetical protein
MPDKPDDLLTLGAQVNGLQGPGIKPWHIKATYQEFDGNHRVSTKGTFEEFWYSEKKYKKSFSFKHYSAKFNQTDTATSSGLFRLGDQDWPGQREEGVQNALTAPILLPPDLSIFALQIKSLTSGGQNLACVNTGLAGKQVEPQYLLQGAFLTKGFCFEDKRPELRVEMLEAAGGQVLFNNVMLFQGRCIARDIELDDKTGTQLKIHVETIETLPDDPSDFAVPAGAKDIFAEPMPVDFGWMTRFVIKTSFAPYQHTFLDSEPVVVSFMIGKDGIVEEAHGVNGSKKIEQAWSELILKWQFRPFLLLGKPVEVKTLFSSHGPPTINVN